MMGNVGFYALRDLGLALRNELNITTFIETGTYKTETTQWAASEFKKVITIEANKQFNERAKRIFQDNKDVRCVYGDSLIKLPTVIRRLKKPALIWLDAHKCRFEDSMTASECPLIAELKAIKETGVNHLIMIDDARMFIEPPPKPYDPKLWPTLEQIKAELPPNYNVSIWHDAVIAVPLEATKIVERFTQPNEMEVIVLTSNDYVHCLPAFSYLFNKYWDASQPVKIVRYDVRPAKMPGNFTNYAIGNQADYTWSSGLIKYLNYHTSDLVLLMLEDYFIDKPVNTKAIQDAWGFMQTNQRIVKMDLTDDRLKFGYSKMDDKYIKSDDNTLFQTSIQAAIWRKDFLLQFLEPSENAWQFEKKGTKRLIEARKAGKFNGLILGCKEPPLSYINAKGGEGTQPEKWDFKKMPEWMVKELKTRKLI